MNSPEEIVEIDVLRRNGNRYVDSGLDVKAAYEEVVLASARLKIESQRYDDAQKRLNEIRKYIEKVKGDDVNQLFSSNIPHQERMVAAFRNMRAARSNLARLLERAVSVGFAKTRAKNYVVCKFDGEGSLVLGPNGLQMRLRVQAQGLNINSIRALLLKNDKIKLVREGLAKNIKEKSVLDRFNKIVEAVGGEDEERRKEVLNALFSTKIEVKLARPVVHESCSIDTLRIASDERLSFEEREGKYLGFEIAINGYDGKPLKKLKEHDVVEYLQVYDLIPAAADEVEASSIRILAGMSAMKKTIEEAFAIQFMTSAL